ncbi:hypothetical protein L0B53_01705 [Vibrio sp. SS-MA-C1-2]|uniref:tight adherence pilus pseudopilin TadF n=1 Tax=Vibrio sp. SS-MA-C1-2 TaxID=2908646 RepID=UPI001F1A2EFB|nr:tight adherence pilus pseudopilin TadF [Vibrio sp. SS-MA-C1-2]UJF17511.1 hypothetical protein L0B53_01705 [Vibrio sp. SS-MA-C1-2]
MKMRAKQKGAFAVELAFIMGILTTVILFVSDLSTQVLTKTQVERVSYSLASTLKERARFYEGRQVVSQEDFEQLNEIAAEMLNLQAPVKRDGYGLYVEALIPLGEGEESSQHFAQNFDSESQCRGNKNIESLSGLMPERDDGLQFPIYQVTVCLKVDGYFSDHTSYRHLQASSVVPGR